MENGSIIKGLLGKILNHTFVTAKRTPFSRANPGHLQLFIQIKKNYLFPGE